MLVLHEMGTGKTCSAIAVMEQLKKEKNGIKGAIYVARGDALINNFIEELLNKCTDGKYIPRDEDGEPDPKANRRRLIRDYYSTKTYETFAKRLAH